VDGGFYREPCENRLDHCVPKLSPIGSALVVGSGRVGQVGIDPEDQMELRRETPFGHSNGRRLSEFGALGNRNFSICRRLFKIGIVAVKTEWMISVHWA
jgi:hypothetical protein